MENKFVIINDKVVFGRVDLHKDLVKDYEHVNFGGGKFKFNKTNGNIEFFGESYQFGKFDRPQLEEIIKNKGVYRYPCKNMSDRYNFVILDEA